METRQQTAEWKEIHNELLKQPFCHNRQQLVRIIICLDYIDCRWEGLCYPCFEQGIKHKLLYTPPIENIPLVKICSDTYDWHSAYNDFKELEYEPRINSYYVIQIYHTTNLKTEKKENITEHTHFFYLIRYL